MTESAAQNSGSKYYFVDEAGDPTLFNAKGAIIAGTAGCSSHFMLGALDVADPTLVGTAMRELHSEIVSDPFYRGVESLKPERGKTHRFLHAKDDLPEIRERVFRLLKSQPVRFYAVVRDKRGFAQHVRRLNVSSPTYHYTPNKLYDELVKRLFLNRLHKDSAYRIVFARRGSRDRTHALREALETARRNFQKKWGIASTAPIEVSDVSSADEYCLQAVDYFLWALHRVYAAGEDRFIQYLWDRCAMVHDVDDRRLSNAGRYYGTKTPLTSASINKEPGI